MYRYCTLLLPLLLFVLPCICVRRRSNENPWELYLINTIQDRVGHRFGKRAQEFQGLQGKSRILNYLLSREVPEFDALSGENDEGPYDTDESMSQHTNVLLKKILSRSRR